MARARDSTPSDHHRCKIVLMTKRTGRARGNKRGWAGTIEQRMAKFTQVSGPDECWLWTGYRNGDGYGIVDAKSIGMRIVGAHRVAYVLAHGPIDPKVKVLHRCDNPPCVNPHHLWLGTTMDNSVDMI